MRPYDPVLADRQVEEQRLKDAAAVGDPLKWRRRRGYVVLAVIFFSLLSIVVSACGGSRRW